MKLSIPRTILVAMIKAGCRNEIVSCDEDRLWGEETLESAFLSDVDMKLLRSAVAAAMKPSATAMKAGADKPSKELVSLDKRLKLMETISSKKGKPVCKPDIMCELLKDYFAETEHHWLFTYSNDSDVLLPYLVTDIKYTAAYTRGEDYVPANVTLKARAHLRGEHEDISRIWEGSDFGLGGCTVEALVEKVGWLRETPELYAAYQEDVKRYQEIRVKLGHQFMATGRGEGCGDDYDQEESQSRYSRRRDMSFDHVPGGARVVMNDTFREGQNLTARADVWAKTLEERDAVVRLPLHCFVVVFDLTLHTFVQVHCRQLTEYSYDKTAEGKLVLSADRKELIEMLITASEEKSEDIIKGKSGGVIMLLSGPPGVGKTLTAEVYSEFIKAPLYVVQCSQLGITAQNLEAELQKVLDRAARWHAILLIDEADVYIRERGADINQNAIVGVFLRILEHYSGVLFLTTNRATTVDDAVMSRMIAHVKYELPSKTEAQKIWNVLARQYDVVLSVSSDDLNREFPDISGRGIKNVLRLAKVLARQRRTQVTLDILQHVYRFQEGL